MSDYCDDSQFEDILSTFKSLSDDPAFYKEICGVPASYVDEAYARLLNFASKNDDNAAKDVRKILWFATLTRGYQCVLDPSWECTEEEFNVACVTVYQHDTPGACVLEVDIRTIL